MLTEGSKAPAFTLPDQDDNTHSLADYAGSWVLIYFYPKDDTPGCTKEACGFRDHYKELEKHNCKVIGVSKDPVAKHKKFVEKYSLPFTLLADESTEMIQSYGAWQEKSMYGKKYMGIARISVLVDPTGVVKKVYPKVKAAEHAAEVLSDVQFL